MSFRLKSLSSLVVVFTLFFGKAEASRGGIEQNLNDFVVGFTYLDEDTPSLCSGVLIAPRVLATARHCVINKQGVPGTKYVFSPPGAFLDAPIDSSVVPTGVEKLIYKKQESSIYSEQIHDGVAFIVTNKAFATGTPIKIATSKDLGALSSKLTISAYGYGAVYETGASYSKLPRKFELNWQNNSLVEQTDYLYEIIDENSVGCQGDSGGPVTMIGKDGTELLIGIVSGAGNVIEGCGTKSEDGYFHLRMAKFSPFLDLLPPSYLQKAIKVICVKGKVLKVVKGVNPKCPTGFRRK